MEEVEREKYFCLFHNTQNVTILWNSLPVDVVMTIWMTDLSMATISHDGCVLPPDAVSECLSKPVAGKKWWEQNMPSLLTCGPPRGN